MIELRWYSRAKYLGRYVDHEEPTLQMRQIEKVTHVTQSTQLSEKYETSWVWSEWQDIPVVEEE